MKKKSLFTRVVLSVIALAVMGMGVLVILPAISPAAGAQVADALRAVFGPDVVANIETVSFRIQDALNQKLYLVMGNKSDVTFDNQNGVQSSASPFAVNQPTAPVDVNQPAAQSSTPLNAVPLPAQNQYDQVSDAGNAVSALPQIGWQAYGPEINGEPVMARALLSLDPKRPYAAIALVRMDLSKLQLHMMPGSLEPAHSWNILMAIPNIGLTPASDQGHIVAGFNGGFKAVNGNYGMMVDNITLLPPLPDIATLAIYKDGKVRIGAWGTDIQPSPDIIAYRQNCPAIIASGKLNPLVTDDNRIVWGRTISNEEVTWRTAVGLSQDGRYLIYAVGNATVVSTLAQALQAAGAYNAMQLDINRHYAHFATYELDQNGHRVAVQLLDQMESDPKIYLVAHSRDYFYLTTK